MIKIVTFLLDILFPPSKEEILIRTLSPEGFYRKVISSPSPPLSFITSVLAYKDPLVSELIWEIKYRKNKHAIQCAAYALHTVLKDRNVVLIPIPLSRKRRKERGYNQCELLIEEIIKYDIDNKFEKRYDVLFRIKHLTRQTDKNREERLKSTQHIFSARRIEELVGRKIIIIDDVTTTGSTLKEARDTLLRAGYTHVQAVTLAH